MAEALKLAQIEAWSYSRFNDYEKCPALAKYKHVDKRKEPDNEAMAKGSRVHELADQYTSGNLRALPAELKKFKNQFVDLKNTEALCEQEWAFDKKFVKVGWFDKSAWLRIKVDAHYMDIGDRVHVIDHKTGRVHPEHELQRTLYALGAFLVYPNAKTVNVYHWYLDSGEQVSSGYQRSELAALKKAWIERTTPMLADKRFAPRPGNHCRWCFFRKSNNGPCSF